MPAEIFELKTNANPFYSAVFNGEDYRFDACVKLKLSEDNPEDNLLDEVVMYESHFDGLDLKTGDLIRFRIASMDKFIVMYRDGDSQADVCLLINDVEIISPCVVTELTFKSNPSNRPKIL